MNRRTRRKRDNETLEQTLARAMKAEIVINLGAGALLVPTDKPLDREQTHDAIEQMIHVAKTGRLKDE